MTALTTEARQMIASSLTNLGFKVYSTVPPTPVPNSVVITPDSPWIRMERIGSRLNYECSWRVILIVDPRSNEQAQLAAEDNIDLILGNVPDGFSVTFVGAPQITDLGGQGSVLATEITISARMKE